MGERSGKVLLGIILLLVGGLMFLDQFGIHLGDLLGILLPAAILVYGARKVLQAESSGKRVWGIFLFLFGLLALFGKLHLLFGSFLAIAVIYLGYRLIRRKPVAADPVPTDLERHWAQAVLKQDDWLDRWERQVRQNHTSNT